MKRVFFPGLTIFSLTADSRIYFHIYFQIPNKRTLEIVMEINALNLLNKNARLRKIKAKNAFPGHLLRQSRG